MCSSTKCHAVSPLKFISLGLKFLVSPFFPLNLCQSASGRDTALGVVMIRPNCGHLGSTVHHLWLWRHHRMRKKLQCIRGALNSPPPALGFSRLHRGLPLGCFQKVSVHERLGPTPKVSDWIGLQNGWSFRNVKNPTTGDWNPCLTHPSQRSEFFPSRLFPHWLFQVSLTSSQDKPCYLLFSGKLGRRDFGLCSQSAQSRD